MSPSQKISTYTIEKLLSESAAIRALPAQEKKRVVEAVLNAPSQKQNAISEVLLKEKTALEAIEKAHQEKMKALSAKLAIVSRELKTMIRKKTETEEKKADEKKEEELLKTLKEI